MRPLPSPFCTVHVLTVLFTFVILVHTTSAQKTPKSSKPPTRTNTRNAAANSITVHPLLPPTLAELERAVAVMKSDSRWPANGRITSLDLREPAKHLLLSNPERIPREMQAIVHDGENKRVYEISVDVTTSSVSEVRRLDGLQPMIYTDDMDTVMALLRRNERWKNAIARRGLADSNIAIDVWASGVPTSAFTDRMARALAFVKRNGINAYDQPIEGLAALVNVSKRAVLEVLDRPALPLAAPNEIMRSHLLRDPVQKSEPRKSSAAKKNASLNKNISLVSKDILTDGNYVRWGPWSFRYLMHAREGLTIYQLRYDARSVAYRMSLSEMVVPYGDTAAHWRWRSAFDVGEYGIGMLAAPLVPGKDVPNNALMVGVPSVTSNGDVSIRDNIVAIYEADAGMAWKHFDVMSGAHMEERGRKLVVTQTSTVGNYDYALSWIFNINGSISFDAALTGILLAKGTSDTAYAGDEGNQKYAHFIAKNLLAPSHQHFFNMRLDMDVDDTANAVSEVDMVRRSVGAENPHGNAIMMEDWDFRFEREAMTFANPTLARMWKIYSVRKNTLGMPTAYTLHPHAGPASFLDNSNLIRRRAAFLTQDLWVTRYHENELFSAGGYPNQSSGDDGLPQYVANNESILRKDIVLWYTFNVTHLARPEDWPIMPAAHAGFSIVPTGFFTQNPAIRLKQ